MSEHAGERVLRFATMLLVIAGATACATQGGAHDTAAREIDVQVPSGGQHLPGTLFVAEGRGPHPTLVWFHGFPGLPAPVPEAIEILRGAGLNILYVHYRGSWGTPGAFGPAHALEDAAATLTHVRTAPPAWRVDPDHIVTAGDSFGSWVALKSAAEDRNVACVAAALVLDLGRTGRDLSSNENLHVAFGGMFSQVEQDAALQFALQGGADGLMSAIIDEQAEHDLRSLAPALQGRPVLLIGAAEDTLAPVATHLLLVAEAMQDAGVDVTRVILPGGHGISDADYAGRMAQWVRGECVQRDAD